MPDSTSRPNHYCKAMGIEPPRLESVKDHPDANFYSLLIVVLLERGGPVTLEEAALRFESAGVAPAAQALQSLKRCKPGAPRSTATAVNTAWIPMTTRRTYGHFASDSGPQRSPKSNGTGSP